MPAEPVTVVEAARELGCTPKTVRCWLRDDAPVVRPGEPVRGRGALVRVPELRRWRRLRSRWGRAEGNNDLLLERIAQALLDVQLRDAGIDGPAHNWLCHSEAAAATHLLFAYQRIHRAITGADPDPNPERLPEPAQQLYRIAEAGRIANLIANLDVRG